MSAISTSSGQRRLSHLVGLKLWCGGGKVDVPQARKRHKKWEWEMHRRLNSDRESRASSNNNSKLARGAPWWKSNRDKSSRAVSQWQPLGTGSPRENRGFKRDQTLEVTHFYAERGYPLKEAGVRKKKDTICCERGNACQSSSTLCKGGGNEKEQER